MLKKCLHRQVKISLKEDKEIVTCLLCGKLIAKRILGVRGMVFEKLIIDELMP
jgi:ribosomal protein S27E